MAETGLEEILKVEPDRGTNPIPHPKERQRTGEATSSRHTRNSVTKTLDRGKAKRQYDKKEVQKPLVSGGFLVTFSPPKKSLRPQAETPAKETQSYNNT